MVHGNFEFFDEIYIFDESDSTYNPHEIKGW